MKVAEDLKAEAGVKGGTAAFAPEAEFARMVAHLAMVFAEDHVERSKPLASPAFMLLRQCTTGVTSRPVLP